MLTTIVSSKMLAAMAAKEGFRFEQTLTGFKWLGNVAKALEEEGYHTVFAFEEAIGFMFGSFEKVRKRNIMGGGRDLSVTCAAHCSDGEKSSTLKYRTPLSLTSQLWVHIA
jgi:phosphomannomutase